MDGLDSRIISPTMLLKAIFSTGKPGALQINALLQNGLVRPVQPLTGTWAPRPGAMFISIPSRYSNKYVYVQLKKDSRTVLRIWGKKQKRKPRCTLLIYFVLKCMRRWKSGYINKPHVYYMIFWTSGNHINVEWR